MLLVPLWYSLYFIIFFEDYIFYFFIWWGKYFILSMECKCGCFCSILFLVRWHENFSYSSSQALRNRAYTVSLMVAQYQLLTWLLIHLDFLRPKFCVLWILYSSDWYGCSFLAWLVFFFWCRFMSIHIAVETDIQFVYCAGKHKRFLILYERTWQCSLI